MQFAKCAILDTKFDEHLKKCVENPFNYILSDYQRCAVKYCKNKSKISYKENREKVKLLWNCYKYDEQLLEVVKNHIKNVPLIIHFNFDVLCKYFETDGKYKNCFEIHNLVIEGMRTHVEDILFNEIYGRSCGKEKPRYGCLNLYLDKSGVTSAKSYGDSYMILKNDVKNRTSFVVGDSIWQTTIYSYF